MNLLKKDVIKIIALLVIAVIGIYVVNAEAVSPGSEKHVLTASKIAIASNDTKAGHYPCRKPSTQRSLCKQSGIGCKAWEVYDACVDGSPYCD